MFDKIFTWVAITALIGWIVYGFENAKIHALNVLHENGFQTVELTGYDPFGCNRADIYRNEFKAIRHGKIVKGTVCEGIFTGAYIRFH